MAVSEAGSQLFAPSTSVVLYRTPGENWPQVTAAAASQAASSQAGIHLAKQQ
jgi:hypothetical protein